MKKRALSVLMVSAMAATLLAGCGTETNEGGNSTTGGGSSNNGGGSSNATYVATSGGKEFNIYCWNDEFRTRVTDHYAAYEAIDANNGKIGDVNVHWFQVANSNNGYQNYLDSQLMQQTTAAADDKVDMFLVEADYALKYVDSTISLPVTELGIDPATDLANQYKYTQDAVTANGELKGVSWQGCPALLIYNREIAKEVFGTDDPATIQEKVKDWDTFMESAQAVVDAGYYMTSSVNDTYRVYQNNVSSPWVDANGKIQVDANIKNWVDQSKQLVDMGATGTHGLWSDDWNKGFYGGVFCYFGPAWMIDFSMAADKEGSVGYDGGWAATKGPQSFFWGGTWMIAANGTDNKDEIKDLMLTMTADKDVLVEIVEKDNDFANHKEAMEELAAAGMENKVCGGQNILELFVEGVGSIDLSNVSKYDQGCNEQFQEAMKNYFNGDATYDEALNAFYDAVTQIYPGLTH